MTEVVYVSKGTAYSAAKSISGPQIHNVSVVRFGFGEYRLAVFWKDGTSNFYQQRLINAIITAGE